MQDENDMSGEAASAGETRGTQRVRAKFNDIPISAETLADAIAKAHARVREDEAKPVSKPLGPTVRASVRCGMETVREDKGDGSYKIVTRPASLDFTADETGDGKPARVRHGSPIRLKRDVFLRLQSEGKVIIAE